jgi:hypothetical protein
MLLPCDSLTQVFSKVGIRDLQRRLLSGEILHHLLTSREWFRQRDRSRKKNIRLLLIRR